MTNIKNITFATSIVLAITLFAFAVFTLAPSLDGSFSVNSVAPFAEAWGDGGDGGCCGSGDSSGGDGDGGWGHFPPPSCTISANPSGVQSGDSTTLSWSSTNAANASLSGVGYVSTSHGSRTVGPANTSTYILTVVGAGGQATCQTTVSVTPPPTPAPTCTLGVNPSTIQQGDSSTLTWNTSNATSVSISNIGSVSLDGSHSVSPYSSTTYILTASGAGGSTTCTRMVTVTTQPDAPTCTLSSNPSSVAYGGSSILRWNSTNATSASLSSVGSVSTQGVRSVESLTSDRTYILTVSGPGGSDTCDTRITVGSQPPEAPTCNIYASPQSVSYNGSSTLHWSSNNANSARINQGIGSVSTSGSRAIYNITGSRTYTMTVYGNGGTQTCSTTVHAGYEPPATPPSCTLNASPTHIPTGGSAVLNWSSYNATSAYLNSVGYVNTHGSRTVSPYQTRTYTLTVRNVQGQSAECSQTIGVHGMGYRPPPIVTEYVTPQPLVYRSVAITSMPYTGAEDIAYVLAMLALALVAAAALYTYRGALASAFSLSGLNTVNTEEPTVLHEEIVEEKVGDSLQLKVGKDGPRLSFTRK